MPKGCIPCGFNGAAVDFSDDKSRRAGGLTFSALGFRLFTLDGKLLL
jgi:hypothetical protein